MADMFQQVLTMLNWNSVVSTTASLLLAITSLLLFGVTLSQLHRHEDSFLKFIENYLKAVFKALTFLGIVIAVYALLYFNTKDFSVDMKTLIRGGTITDQQRANWTKQWGDALSQKELVVEHYVERNSVIEVPGKEGEILYQNKTITEEIQQERVMVSK